MIIRKFKPGDRVLHRPSGQVMEVIKYVTKKAPLVGQIASDEEVQCVWFEKGVRKTEIFHQRTLTKDSSEGGLFIDPSARPKK
ncbi:MAG: hypothetical protein R3350_08775 [Saprospiraceae bacterium]|nr:hypothetical protein [Saprospiraceae bacterium]